VTLGTPAALAAKKNSPTRQPEQKNSLDPQLERQQIQNSRQEPKPGDKAQGAEKTPWQNWRRHPLQAKKSQVELCTLGYEPPERRQKWKEEPVK
jgi:hypothetical protein